MTITSIRRAGIAAAFFMLLGLSVVPGVASAADQQPPPRFTITPAGGAGPFFKLMMNAGDSRDLGVVLHNGSNAPANARTYAADAFTTVNGGLGAKLWGDPKHGTTSWLTYPDETISFGPNADVQRPVLVRVPSDASPGEHLAALVVENADLYGSGGETQQRLRQVIAVLIDVAGPRTPGLSIGTGHHLIVGKRSVVAVALQNTGNVLLKPSGPVSITDKAGNEVVATTVKFGSLYAGDTADLEIPLASALQPGEYVAHLSLKDAATSTTAQADVPFEVSTADAAKAAAAPADHSPPEVNQTPATVAPAAVADRHSNSAGPSPLLLVGASVVSTVAVLGGGSLLLRRRRASAARRA